LFKRIAIASAAAAAALMLAPTVRAQGNLRPAPTGGRSQLMGGTGIALGDDSAAPFLNPAAIVRIPDTGVAFSSAFYAFTTTHFQRFHQPSPSDPAFGPLDFPDTDLNRGRIDGIPATLCFFLTFRTGESAKKEAAATSDLAGRQKVAACLGNLERTIFDATGQSYAQSSGTLNTNQTLSVTHRYNRLYAGPTYSVYVTNRLALGASLYGIVTTTSSTYSVDAVSYRTGALALGSAFDTALNAYSVDAGLLFGINYHLSGGQILGLTFSTPTLHAVGGYRATTTTAELSPAPTTLLTSANGGFVAPPPLRLGAGLGAEYGRWRIEGDVTGWIPIQPFMRATPSVDETVLANARASSSSFDATVQTDAKAIVDSAVGLEYFVSQRFSLLMGASTDWSVIPPYASNPPATTLVPSRTQRVAVSFGAGGRIGNAEIVAGTELSYGWGTAVAVDPFATPPHFAVVDTRSFGVMLVAGGRTSFGSLHTNLKKVIWGEK
jgi:hypothetical protein